MVKHLISNITKFSARYCIPGSTYNKQVELGQSAKTLVIGCADSLVDPALLMGSAPGELFVHRNIAGIVPSVSNTKSSGTNAVLDYAVNTLNVKDIIVMGHGHCGGIKSILKDGPQTEIKSYADAWLDNIRSKLSQSIQKNNHLSPAEIQTLCEQQSVQISLENLATYPCIIERLAANNLNLHAWYFDRGQFSIYEQDRWQLQKEGVCEGLSELSTQAREQTQQPNISTAGIEQLCQHYLDQDGRDYPSL